MENNITNPTDISSPIPESVMILGEGQYYDMDCYKTKRNNNVLVVGAAGAGKTRTIVIPNLLQATGSYIVCDPKGSLYKQYNGYLRCKGYQTKLLNFDNPEKSIKYNFFRYIHSETDITKIAHMIVYSSSDARKMSDPFWDRAAQELLICMIAYLWEFRPKCEQNMNSVLKLLEAMELSEFNDVSSPFDRIMEDVGKQYPTCLAYRSYTHYMAGAIRTKQSIQITLSSIIGRYCTDSIINMLSDDETDIGRIGKRKTAFFVQVSDTDRSMDDLANLFFTQAMNELCRVADNSIGYRLPYDVRFILDDFATNCRIDDFPRMISSIRSRGINTTIIVQSEAQLTQGYGHDGQTIIANCDTYVYLGCNDLSTAESVAKKANLPTHKILYMPVESAWIFRRGELPVNCQQFALDEHLENWGTNLFGVLIPYITEEVSEDDSMITEGLEDLETLLEKSSHTGPIDTDELLAAIDEWCDEQTEQGIECHYEIECRCLDGAQIITLTRCDKPFLQIALNHANEVLYLNAGKGIDLARELTSILKNHYELIDDLLDSIDSYSEPPKHLA
ncbi:MAG: VirD4-like conjugal transfer protein, CD1115 family [Lachnospiraceae bacterium]